MTDDPIDRLQATREIDFGAFEERVREEAEVVREHLAAGTFDNEQVTLGLEYEFYAVDRDTRRLRRVPRSLLSCLGFEKELGLHNAELNGAVQPCNDPGIEALERDVEAKVSAIQTQAAGEGIRLVSDGLWTVGPAANTTRGYLVEATHEEGLTLAINVSNAVRYHGFASSRREIGGHIDVPGVTVDADSPGPVSLTTSIQPHYQFRRARDLPDHFGNALRVAGPLVALGANSPFFPPELYDDAEPDRELLLRESWVENRIPVYEGMMNPTDGPQKVRFPADVDSAAAAVDRVVDDRTIVPASIDAGQRFDDAFVHLRHKHGSYWRWVRPVFGGASEVAANVRIEFRPLPGQPTIPDTVGFVALFAGLLSALHGRDHPAGDLSWEQARENFYAAARDGLAADLVWVTADGERTGDTDRLFADLFDAAVDGLVAHGVPAARARARVEPLRHRVEDGATPAEWKRDRVRAGLDAGLSAAEAVEAMQREYIDCQAETLLSGSLADWPAP
jgi:gamma-glutamyl:cysteine ligase YbdK (ATP-grasp superfamily)